MQATGSVHKLNYLQHREEKVAADLALIATLLNNSRENGTIGGRGASYNQQASVKATGKNAAAKLASTSMLRRTARSKCKLLHVLLRHCLKYFCWTDCRSNWLANVSACMPHSTTWSLVFGQMYATLACPHFGLSLAWCVNV